MREKEEFLQWINRGRRQRRAVVLAVRKPMTHSEIWNQARKNAPKICRRDVTRILYLLLQMGIIYYVTPDVNRGRLYWLTDFGRNLVSSVFDVSIRPCSRNIDWLLYSYVVTSPTRKIVVKEIMEAITQNMGPLTASDIRRIIHNKYQSISFSQVHRAIIELKTKKIIRRVGYTLKNRLKIYSLTPQGRDIATELP